MYVISKFLVNSRLLVVKVCGNQKLNMDFSTVQGISTPNPCFVEESTIVNKTVLYTEEFAKVDVKSFLSQL